MGDDFNFLKGINKLALTRRVMWDFKFADFLTLTHMG
jgi:hypothetical protein